MHSSFTYNPNAHRASSYQQQSGFQQPIYNIGVHQGFNSGFVSHQPNFFVNHSFTRSFASVVSCENDLAKRQQMNNANMMNENHNNSQNSGIWGNLLRHFKPPQYQQRYQAPPTIINQKQFEDFTHMPSLLVNHNLPPNPNHYNNQNQHYYQQPPVVTASHINMQFHSDPYAPVQPSANFAPVANNFMTTLFGGYQQPQPQGPPKPRNQWWFKKGFRYRGWRGGRNNQNKFHDHEAILPKNVHEKERSSIERNIQDDSCDFVDVMEDKDVLKQLMGDEMNNPNKTADGSCYTTTKSDDLPFTICSLEDFPAIIATPTKKTAGKKASRPAKQKDSKDVEGFVVVPTDAPMSTPSFTPKRISVCEKIIGSPQRLLQTTMPMIRKSCLKPSRRFDRESECSDDFIVFADECDGGDEQDEIFCDGGSDSESESDDSDDEMDGIEEQDEDEEMSEDEDDETLEIQVDSGVEEKKVS
jgi:hypothetical protein